MSIPWPTPNWIKKIQQHPQELIEFCAFIRNHGVTSYLEIGCKYGGSLYHIAQHLPPKSRVVAVDLPHGQWGRADSENPLRECVMYLKKQGYDAHLFLGDSTDETIVNAVKALAPFDCILIDANHTEPYVRKDFANYGRLAAKYCCFHDIGWASETPKGKLPIEVPKVWAELKQELKDVAGFREIKHDKGHNGIGIIKWQQT